MSHQILFWHQISTHFSSLRLYAQRQQFTAIFLHQSCKKPKLTCLTCLILYKLHCFSTHVIKEMAVNCCLCAESLNDRNQIKKLYEILCQIEIRTAKTEVRYSYQIATGIIPKYVSVHA